MSYASLYTRIQTRPCLVAFRTASLYRMQEYEPVFSEMRQHRFHDRA